LVNTSGIVVSPTNFWDNSPNFASVQDFITVVTNQTNTLQAGRNVYSHSLATNVSGVTNTILLPTNGETQNADLATIIHTGSTSSVTQIRQQGETSNLVSINGYTEAVRFIFDNGAWVFDHNISFVEPIYFSGTNVEYNKGVTRTNLGLGASNDVAFQGVITKSVSVGSGGSSYFTADINMVETALPIEFANNSAPATRSNLGLPLAALTNTNNATFQQAVFTTNTTPAAAANLGDVKAWLEISVVTNSVTNSFRVPLFQ